MRLVVDLPTAFYITSAQVTGSMIVGQLPVTGKPEQFGALLDKGSPLTSCVSKAVEALKASGTAGEDPGQVAGQGGQRSGPAVSPGSTGEQRRHELVLSDKEQWRRQLSARQRRRSTMIASLSTVVFVGRRRVRRDQHARAGRRPRRRSSTHRCSAHRFPAIAAGVPAQPRDHGDRRDLHPDHRRSSSRPLRTSTGAVLAPVRGFASVYVDFFRGCPLIILLYLFGLGDPVAAAALRHRTRRRSGARSRSSCATAPTSPRSSAPASSRCTPASAPPLARSGSPSGRRCASSCCRRRSATVFPPLLNDFVALQKDVGLIAIVGGTTDAVQQATIDNSTDVQLHAVPVSRRSCSSCSPCRRAGSPIGYAARANSRQQAGAVV